MNFIEKFSLLLFFVKLLFFNLFGQVIYTSPINNSAYNMPQTSIIIRFASAIYDEHLKDNFVLKNQQGKHLEFSYKLTENNTCLLIKPKKTFNIADTIVFSLINPIKQINAKEIDHLRIIFFITRKIIRDDHFKSNLKHFNNNKSNLPNNFPEFTITVNNQPAPGKIFFYNLSELASSNDRFMAIIDSVGNVLYYRQKNNEGLNFTLQPSGYLSYWNNQNFVLMDTTFQIIDTIACQNGYDADWHEFIHLENKHSLLFSWDMQNIDMSQIVEGGKNDALVQGVVIQELDENKNVVFQWRSWDHFKITDGVGIDFTSYSVQYVHANAMDVDTDGNILLSSRVMNEITKIDRTTGDIIWRLGGKNNQFTFINDSVGFCRQHDIRRIANGNITLFDNGSCHSNKITSVKEYKLDETNLTAKLVWHYEHPSNIYSEIMGNAQRLPNGNTYINWGGIVDNSIPSITEVKPDKTIVFELFMNTYFHLIYRSHKFPWEYTYNPTTGINKQVKSNIKKLKLFPNPVISTARIETPNSFISGKLSVYDINGKILKEIFVSNKSFIVDLSFLKKGKYLILVEGKNNKLYYQSFIKL